MKLGLWLPYREGLTGVSIDRPGMLLKEVRENLVKEIQKDRSIQVTDDLDFRKAIIREGDVYLEELCFSELDAFLWFGEIDRRIGSYHVEVLEQISKKTRVINDPKALGIGFDKFKSLSLLQENGVKVPPIALLSNDGIDQVGRVLKEWGEVVVKPRLGCYGIGMVRLSDEQTMVDVLDYSEHKTHYIEKFIPNRMQDWVGVNVINGKIIHGYGKAEKYISDWKIHDRTRSGGHMMLRTLDKEQRDIALAVGEITGLDMYGVDLIKDKDGQYYVVDVNTFPGLYPEMLEKAENNAYKEIAALLKQEKA